MKDVDVVALSVFVALFALVTVVGFFAARWRKADLDQLSEWGLGGRRFGTTGALRPVAPPSDFDAVECSSW